MKEKKEKKGDPAKVFAETVCLDDHESVPQNAVTLTDMYVGIYICSIAEHYNFEKLKQSKQPLLLQFPDEPIQLTDEVTLTHADIIASVRKFKANYAPFAVDVAFIQTLDILQSGYEGKLPLSIVLADEQFFAIKKQTDLSIKTLGKKTGRSFPKERKNDTLLECVKLTAQPDAFPILDAICSFIPPENIHKRPKVTAEKRSPRGWECFTTSNPKRFIATIYLTSTEKLCGVLPLIGTLEKLFKEQSLKCSLGTYPYDGFTHQVLQVEYDLPSLRRLPIAEMSRRINNIILKTKIPPFHPTERKVVLIPQAFDSKDWLVLTFVLSQPHDPAKNKDIHLFHFGRGDHLRTHSGDVTITHNEICETFRKFRAIVSVELTDYRQRILDVLNAENTQCRKLSVLEQCRKSDIVDEPMEQLMRLYESSPSLSTDLSSVMTLSTQQVELLRLFFETKKAQVGNLGEITHVRDQTFPTRGKLVAPTEIKEMLALLDQLSEPIPLRHIYLRATNKKSERGWECYTTTLPNRFVATLYFAEPTAVEQLATLFRTHDIPADVLTVVADGSKPYSTLAIAIDMKSLRSLDIDTLRKEINALFQPKPAAAPNAPHSTHFRPAAKNGNAQTQPPKSQGSSQQKSHGRKK